ncbi:MAG: hypothetical protein KDK70_09150 [Myxococcales bacterium]|nr:hypothetical protein [Myxococcales bacterium]
MDRASVGGDPMRRLDAPVEHTMRCPACGQPSAVDVSYDSVALTLCESDAATHQLSVPPWMAVTGVSFVPAALVTIGLLDGWTFTGFFWLAAVGLPVLGTALLSILSRLSPRQRRPQRWRLVPPPRGRVCDTHAGSVFGRRKLWAPISGRECVAYEVAIAPAGVRPRTDADWLVREQGSATLVLGDHAVEGRDVALLLDSGSRAPLQADPAAVSRFLRARGVITTPDAVDVYETIVSRGQAVTLCRHRGSAVHTLRLQPAHTPHAGS